MKKLLLCLIAVLVTIACNPNTSGVSDIETDITVETTPDEPSNNGGISGGLEDPIENPEQEW